MDHYTHKSIEKEEDLDIEVFFKKIKDQWKLILSLMVVGMACGVGYILVTPPSYGASVTFFIPSTAEGGAYSFFRRGESRGVEGQFTEIIKSKRLKKELAIFIKEKYPNQKVMVGNLTITQTPTTGLLRIENQAKSKELALEIIVEAVKQSKMIYEDLQLSVEKNPIKILDDPSVKPKPVSPQKIKSILLGTILGGILGAFLAMIRTPKKSKSRNSAVHLQ